MKYKLSEEEILALYPLVSAQRIIEDFSQERTFTLSGFYKLYNGKNNHNALRKAFNLKRTISGKLP